MLNILIADSDFHYARELMSSINETSNEARICNITMDGKETIEILEKVSNIDIVLLKLKMPIYTANQIINKLSNKQKCKYKNSFIIISEKYSIKSKNLLKNDIVYKILPKTLGVCEISSEVNMLVKQKDKSKEVKDVQQKIINELLYLGYEVSHKGTRYLIEVLKIVYVHGEGLTENLNKYVYPTIAKRYHQSINNIKCNIRRATEFMYYNCEEEKLKSYFLYNELYKPNIKTIIHTVLTKITK